LVILMEKMYENEKGYFYIPVVWREEFNLQEGQEVGIDLLNDVIMIDKTNTREFNQIIVGKGKLTIPIELREKLKNKFYNIFILQRDKKIILTPIKD
jgi:bifunctional DNA-binding transcriptional regulator/antitoxin component of YhaV-PrlF toxin-antitoxin module